MGTGAYATLTDSTASISYTWEAYRQPRYIIDLRVRHAIDPEEMLIAKLRQIEQRQRRELAHREISEKRKVVDINMLLAQFDSPENRVSISQDDLQEILDSYPEDD